MDESARCPGCQSIPWVVPCWCTAEADPAALYQRLDELSVRATDMQCYDMALRKTDAVDLLNQALTARLLCSATEDHRERCVDALMATVAHQRWLVMTSELAFSSELRVAGHRVDAALAALAACGRPHPATRVEEK